MLKAVQRAAEAAIEKIAVYRSSGGCYVVDATDEPIASQIYKDEQDAHNVCAGWRYSHVCHVLGLPCYMCLTGDLWGRIQYSLDHAKTQWYNRMGAEQEEGWADYS